MLESNPVHVSSARTRSLIAVVTATALIFLNASGTRLNSVSAATMHGVEATEPTLNGTPNDALTDLNGQLSPIELPSTLETAFDRDKSQEQNASPRLSAQLAPDGTQSAKPAGHFQTQNCIDPHPGTPQTRQQQIDNCHVQIWLTYNDGCTGYKVVAPSGGTCPNGAQQTNDSITWTKCVAKHSA